MRRDPISNHHGNKHLMLLVGEDERDERRRGSAISRVCFNIHLHAHTYLHIYLYLRQYITYIYIIYISVVFKTVDGDSDGRWR